MSDQEELRKQNIDVVSRFLDAISRWDVPGLAGLYHDDVHQELPYAPAPFPRESFGKKDTLAIHQGAAPRIESLNLYDVVIDTLAGDPARLIATCKADTKLKPNMTPYRNRYIAEFTILDGKVKYFGEYFDPIALVTAFGDGAVPEKKTDPSSTNVSHRRGPNA